MHRGLTDTEKKLAKKLQRLAEEEIGTRPKLTYCQRLLIEALDAGPLPGDSKEERIAALFVATESRIRMHIGMTTPPIGGEK